MGLGPPVWYRRVVQMALRMPQPWKHPKTGIYHFRRAVPKDLWTVVGKREEKETLGTKDVTVAKRRFVEALVQCEERWANLRVGARRLTESEAHKLAAGIHDRWLLIYGDNPTSQLTWHPEWFDRLWSEKDLESAVPIDPGCEDGMPATVAIDQNSEDGMPPTVAIDQIIIPAMRKYCLKQTQFLVEDRGLFLDDWSLHMLQRAVAAALQRASLKLRDVELGKPILRNFQRRCRRCALTLQKKGRVFPKKASMQKMRWTRWWTDGGEKPKSPGKQLVHMKAIIARLKSFRYSWAMATLVGSRQKI